ncbi:MAG TPA: polysaccharide deacetylase family protein, partial [Angustibacter sp.]|nr:polysaccharide deacetylase family protein [Angustibacter sp.]
MATALCLVLAGATASTGAVHVRHASDRSVQAARAAASVSVGLPATSPAPAPARSAVPPRPHRADAASRPPVTGKVLYLTFDDGPDPHWTPQVLALLARYHARATFFEVGSQVREHPQAAAAVRAAGQAVGNHTGNHQRLTDLDPAAMRQAVLTGPPDTTCLRPPYGSVDHRVRALAAQLGLSIVLWNVETDDWAKPGVASIEQHLLHDVRPGRTVILHDGGGDRSQTVAALRRALPVLAARGYRFEAV